MVRSNLHPHHHNRLAQYLLGKFLLNMQLGIFDLIGRHNILHLHHHNHPALCLLGKFLLNMLFEMIGPVGRHNILHLHQYSLLEQ
jgi:hypothetical protein